MTDHQWPAQPARPTERPGKIESLSDTERVLSASPREIYRVVRDRRAMAAVSLTEWGVMAGAVSGFAPPSRKEFKQWLEWCRWRMVWYHTPLHLMLAYVRNVHGGRYDIVVGRQTPWGAPDGVGITVLSRAYPWPMGARVGNIGAVPYQVAAVTATKLHHALLELRYKPDTYEASRMAAEADDFARGLIPPSLKTYLDTYYANNGSDTQTDRDAASRLS